MSKFEFVSKDKINKGWSTDEKYCVETSEGTKYLLRVNTKGRAEKLKNLYDVSIEINKLDIPFCNAIEYGTEAESEYILQRWVIGEVAEDLINTLSKAQQYKYGLEAGQIAKKIHSIQLEPTLEDWETYFNSKIDRNINYYNNCSIKLKGDNYILEYIEKNRHLLKDRPITFQHGDFHIGNMMIENGVITIIDFDRFSFGDPWEEFNRIVWCAQTSPIFATGIVNGYFDNEVPLEFWKLLALYICSNTLAAIHWSVTFGEKEIRVMIKQGEEILKWYNNMENVVPSWYQGII